MPRGRGRRRTGRWPRLLSARWALPLAGVALLIADTLSGSARPLHAQDPGGSVATDRVALMALYEATGGPNWTDNTNWGSAPPLGTRHGVTTDLDGRVIHLSLTGNNLRGPLPPAVGRLAQLRFLSLGVNRLSGEIPATLGDLIEVSRRCWSGNDGGALRDGVPLLS